MYSIQKICSVVHGQFIKQKANDIIEHLIYDTRRIQQSASSLFFALKTQNNDGHKFFIDAYKKGVRNFIVSDSQHINKLDDSTIILVDDTLRALQELAAYHRQQFLFPIIGITGSNGKTVVKEWMYQLLEDDYKIIRSPKSFNSQIGVPLSVWQLSGQYDLGIFEAGISSSNEMEKLEQIIKPTIGVLTNIGEAHDAGFSSRTEKLQEKLKLFNTTDVLVANDELIKNYRGKSFSWNGDTSDLHITSIKKQPSNTIITAKYKEQGHSISIPFTDDASIENAINCWCILLYLKIPEQKISDRFLKLHPVDMRLQLKHGFNGCMVINDSYSADVTSLKIALDFLQQQSAGLKRTVIISDFIDTGKSKEELYAEIFKLLNAYGIEKIIAIGSQISELNANHNISDFKNYSSTDDFIIDFKSSYFFNEIVLIKGARKYEFERIACLFDKKLHQTVLEINLNALALNLKEYQRLLQPNTKVMAMVKAFSYGSGGAEIASVLQYHNTDYLGVAYADEGVELVKAGISLPIMVMNTEESSFQAIVDYNLQPVIYSFELQNKFENYLKEQGLQSYPVHIEIETGMNRLGFDIAEIEQLSQHIASTSILNIQSVFTHLAASEDFSQDAFTNKQAYIFEKAVFIIKKNISYPFLKHIANSAAIVRHPQLQLDMVRLGIGLYGIEGDSQNKLHLQTVATLRSTVAQVKHIKKGESVSYNRREVVNRNSIIATIRIGYADGYSRQFSNGVGKMWINGKLAPVIGSVCMDMTMIDVTDIAGVKEGDEVIVFGQKLPVQKVSSWIKTIPYELMTGVSQRVKRIYFHE